MKNFWPHRPLAKGFSIESLARKYREKISTTSFNTSSDRNNNDLGANFRKESEKEVFKTYFAINKRHWANRDFSEYIDAA